MKVKFLQTFIKLGKYSFYVLCLTFFSLNSLVARESKAQVKSVKEVQININLNHVSLSEALKAIEEKTSYNFIVSREKVDLKQKVDVVSKNNTVEKVLLDISRQANVIFQQINENIDVKKVNPKKSGKLAYVEILAFVEISGKITNEDGEGLPGASIVVKGTTNGTTTDFDGNYKLSVPDDAVLIISFVGYLTEEVEVGTRGVIDVQLALDLTQLEELVVVGYGTSKKGELISAVGSIEGEDLMDRPTRNLSTGLQGLIPGLTIWDQGGEPGTNDATIRIRGVTTTGNNDPLVIVDGMEQRLGEINPADIETVSVLKDAASTAIYGSRAANGVILITTKRGKTGKLRISYTGTYELQNLTNPPEAMDTEAYMRLDNLARVNQGTTPLWSEEDIAITVAGTDPFNYPEPNIWFDVALDENAPIQNHSLSVSGGNELVKTFVNLNFQDQKSVFKNRDFKRYQLRLNNDFKITEEFEASADLRILHSKRSRANSNLVYSTMTHASQFAVPYYPDGSYGLSPQRHNPLLWGDPDIVGLLVENINYMVTNLKGTYKIMPNLKFSSQLGLELTEQKTDINTPTYEILDFFTGDILRNNTVNSLSQNVEERFQLTWNNTLHYDLEVDDHRINALVGFSQITNDLDSLYAYGRNFYNNEIRGMEQSETDSRILESRQTEWGLRSFFGRIGYAYQNRYLVELNGRYDGSSRFSKGNRFSFFPSFSAGWIISNESFWNNLTDKVDLLKIRGSHGKAGNQNVGLYTFYENLIVGNDYVFNDEAATTVKQITLASNELTWETVTQTNIGIDASLFNGRLEVSIDWFKKTTEDILLELPIAGVVGLSPQATNAGSVENKGWEFQAGYRNFENELKYSINFNLSDVRNTVLNLEGTGPYQIGNTRIDEGEEMNYLFGYKTDGLLTQEDFDSGYPTISSNSQVGDIKLVDQLTEDTNGDGIPDATDGIISPADYKVNGSTIPRFTYGANIGLIWKNFDFNMQLQGVLKQDFRMQGALIENGSWFGMALAIGEDYYTEENPNARFPRPEKQNVRNIGFSDWWVINGAYLRIKNIQIGYNIPDEILERVGIEKLRVFAGATNFLTFSALNDWGVDAEAPSGRALYHPPVKTYVFGLNLDF